MNQTMTTRSTEPSQGDGGNPAAQPGPPGPPDPMRSRGGNKIYKCGPLFISSKGIGWTSWKKRWFILTRTSLVFFRSDPSAIPQKGSEVNLTLGGIDLNNSGSVVVKADKKLLTVLFPDGRDGRAFTLKAETSEDLYEWKTALEEALAQAPSAALVMGQNGIFRNDQADAADDSFEQVKDRLPVKSLVIGRPILLALEDIDGTPSFLEKALRFIEGHGVKVEGILRQAAAVDDVEHRVREYEQGKSEFSPDEDPHIVADCVKYVMRELPSSPVPASCCNALLEACRTDRGTRVTAMRSAICETFPEPNRCLLQRILMMMQTVASHKAENRMSTSAVAACMAPLLLRPLLAGDCELENDFDVGGDGSVQLLQAAAAANHAQAIVITLLEDYDNIFGEGSMSPELYSDSEESGSESEELTDDDGTFEDDDATEGSDADVDEDFEHASNGTCSEASDAGDNDLYDDKSSEGSSSGSKSPEVDDHLEANQQLSPSSPQTFLPQHDNVQGSENFLKQGNNSSGVQTNESVELLGDDPAETSSVQQLIDKNSPIQKSATISNGPVRSVRRPTVLGRTPAKKNLSMESIDLSIDDEDEIQRLEVTKTSLLLQLVV
uniref:Putative rho GTPase-activating protein REN1 n=1 Tax=Davidia involucrata TaxID=16924 RepID=A0A5B6YI02_DAVIN